MNIEQFVDEAKAAIARAKTLAEELWAALPAEFAHPALDAAKAGIADLGTLATAEVEKVVPPIAQPTVDDLISAIEAKAESDIAAITTAKDAQVSALQSAKAAVAA